MVVEWYVHNGTLFNFFFALSIYVKFLTLMYCFFVLDLISIYFIATF